MRVQQIITAIAMAIGFVYAISLLMRPDPSTFRLVAKGSTAYGYGVTRSDSVGVARSFFNENPQVNHLVLRMMPGTKDADMNLRIARMIRKRGISTHLERRSYIASGAVDLFLAGTERTMDCGASIGVHSWSADGVFSPKDLGYDDRQRLHERFLRDMGVDPDFYVFTREAAPPEDIHILSPDEIIKYDLLTEDLHCDT